MEVGALPQICCINEARYHLATVLPWAAPAATLLYVLTPSLGTR